MIRRTVTMAVLLVGSAFAAIQFVPYGRDHSNPPQRIEPMWDSATTRLLAQRACFDCHSNETAWPVYANIAPASWLVQHDVAEGRTKLNFSEWHRSQKEAGEAGQSVAEGEMPPASYVLMHEGARLTATEREQLIQGLARTIGAASRGHERH